MYLHFTVYINHDIITYHDQFLVHTGKYTRTTEFHKAQQHEVLGGIQGSCGGIYVDQYPLKTGHDEYFD